MITAIKNSINKLEKDYLQKTELAHRKKFAQFFTPPKIANLMTLWLLGNQNMQTVLEPAFGLGIFSRLLLSHKQNLQIKGYEVDNVIYEDAKRNLNGASNIDLQLQDYMYNDWSNKYDGIICNPPYFKFHDYDNKNILKEIEEKLSFQLNGFTNLYTLFLLKSISQLNENGRAAYIVPSEFLNSDYGKNVKQYLINSKLLRHILIIDFKENTFDDALTTSSILLFAKDDNFKKVNFTTITTVDDLETFQNIIVNYPNIQIENSYNLEKLDATIKWRNYYQKQNALKYKDLVPFSNYGKVVRGIATGDNDYFMFNAQKAKQFGISEKYLLPCISKSTDIAKSFFTQTEFEKLTQENKNVFLFNAIKPISNQVENYIKKGETAKVNEKYLTASRNPWYALENRLPAPILVSVFHRNDMKFIRNLTNVRNLTTFHCIYPNMLSLSKIDFLFAYLLTDIAQEIFNDNRREYGDGLKKFEPNDINKAKMLDIDKLDKTTENKILDLYKQYQDEDLRVGVNSEILKEINEIFTNYYLIK